MAKQEENYVSFASDEAFNFTQIPNCISDLTYSSPKDGKLMRLSVQAKELYRVLRMTAGDKGVCWRSTENLAEICNMSVGAVSNAKAELFMPMHQLNNTPLIQISIKTKSVSKESKCIGKTQYHHITICNIWAFNNIIAAMKKEEAYQEKLKKAQARSPHESARGADSPHESGPPEARSPHERNKNTDNKNPLFNEQQTTPEGVSAASKQKGGKLSASQQKAFDWLIEKGCEKGNAESIATNFSSDDIVNASSYTSNQLKKNAAKNKKTPNKWGYFQTVLSGRYWEKN